MKLQFSRDILEKHSSTTFHENPSRERDLFYTDREMDMAKLIMALRNPAKAPKKARRIYCVGQNITILTYFYKMS